MFGASQNDITFYFFFEGISYRSVPARRTKNELWLVTENQGNEVQLKMHYISGSLGKILHCPLLSNEEQSGLKPQCLKVAVLCG
jgi:hypothetical protein